MVPSPVSRRRKLMASGITRDVYQGDGRTPPVARPLQIDLDFDLLTVDGEDFPARQLLGRPTILILLRYLG